MYLVELLTIFKDCKSNVFFAILYIESTFSIWVAIMICHNISIEIQGVLVLFGFYILYGNLSNHLEVILTTSP